MAEKSGRFEKGVWVEDKQPAAPQAASGAIDQRLSDATKSVRSSIDNVVHVTHDLVATPEGKAFIETTIKDTQKHFQVSFDALISRAKAELEKTKIEIEKTKAELDKKVAEKLELVGMRGVQKLKPAELSGGMKKRVGLARALITDPDYIFYDEPTTGLDPIMSDSIDDLIKELTDKLNATSVVVTHDMYSVKNVANQVAMMHEGKIHFHGTPAELLSSNDKIIKEFIQRTE